ncbi:CinA family protein [Oryzibacter oryziterrae]|uniref:CinA family protein n=1 Tax=Oryzibacter oryziterrae TaxID=2766474 RepID=UPI001F28C336|nr:nicotinamide-nucleotide amidohydrolase family protein [Oryzibacter oryziterrae]
MTDLSPLEARATDILAAARTKGLKIATAESCTGGLIAGLLTEIAGSSDVFERGFVTYSNEAKAEMLGVPAELIAARGAVSTEVALAMAEGALTHSRADIAVAVTGIAGPGGGSATKPVGLVFVAIASKKSASMSRECRFGALGRSGVRQATIAAALELIEEALRA